MISLGLLTVLAAGGPTGVVCSSPTGSFVGRAAAGGAWRVVGKGEAVRDDELLVALPDATLENGKVRLRCRADYDRVSPLPVLEAAVRVRRAAGVDLDLEIDRGWLELIALKPGKTSVRLRFRDFRWSLTLDGRGTQVAVQVYGRWPRGVGFRKNPPPGHQPTVSLALLGLKGAFSVETDRHEYGMSAPPGPALLMWDCASRVCTPPGYLAKLPAWADPSRELSPRAAELDRLLKEFRELRLKASVGEAIDRYFASGGTPKQQIALVTMGALDDLPRLSRAMRTLTDPQVVDFGVSVVRHWMGREPGQDLKLYRRLAADKAVGPTQAHIVMELLHSFGERAVREPVTYEVLIEYLLSDVRPVRNLAAWHLYRMVPSLREKIPFKPNGEKEDFRRAYTQWKKAVPTGSLPPAGG